MFRFRNQYLERVTIKRIFSSAKSEALSDKHALTTLFIATIPSFEHIHQLHRACLLGRGKGHGLLKCLVGLACPILLRRLLLFGCGGHARALIDIIESTTEWQIAGLVNQSVDERSDVLGYPVIGSDSDLASLRKEADSAVLAFGHFGNAAPRRSLAARLSEAGFTFPAIISAHAIVSRHTRVGEGTTIGHGVIVNAGASIGNHCIINSRALIEHDVSVEHHCHVSTGVMINGGAHVGEGSFIGSGTMVRECIVLPSHTILSAGKRIMGWPMREN